ncbi:hypothetical protein LEM8419_00551 [Neolewinella maritima]|uniref:Uncharacterized protein n=1 Tax=Neolewinella maritima TaxID=1383882 RepID=A0ABN8F5D9_9BACT|nr:hypothetical protein [Neolewinella maritima]CAH0999254.1 hypothetical protein LEM8419_00551 [Neolewinella maritima]
MLPQLRYTSRFRLRLRRLRSPLPPTVVATHWLDRIFQLFDLLYLFDLYEVVSNALSPELRGLTAREYHMLYPYFGDSVPYHRVRIDERAHLGPRSFRFYYVSFHTINSWGSIPLATLVHEMVHVWQYEQHGAVYIPRALVAQHTRSGYDYGGRAGLAAARSLADLNYEQQAAAVEDAFRLANGLPTRWMRGAKTSDLPDFEPFLSEIRYAIPPN